MLGPMPPLFGRDKSRRASAWSAATGAARRASSGLD